MLPAKVACPHCHTGLRAQRPLAPGTRVTCPRCRAAFTVPAEAGPPAPVGPPPLPVSSPSAYTATAPRPNGPVAPPAETAPPDDPPSRVRKALAWLLVGAGALGLAALAYALV